MEKTRLAKAVVEHAFPVAGAVSGLYEGLRHGDDESRLRAAEELGGHIQDYRRAPKDPVRWSRRTRVGCYALAPVLTVGALAAAVIDTNLPKTELVSAGGHGTIIAEYVEKLGCYGGNVTRIGSVTKDKDGSIQIENGSWGLYSRFYGVGPFGVHGTMKVSFSGDVNAKNCINKDRGLEVTYTPDKDDPTKYIGNILVLPEGMEIQIHDENVVYTAPETNWAQNFVDAANQNLKALSLGIYSNDGSATAYQQLQNIARMEGEKTAIEVCGPMAFADYKDEYAKELAADVKGWDGSGKYKVPPVEDIKEMNVTFKDGFDKIAFQYPFMDDIHKNEAQIAAIGKDGGDSVEIHQPAPGTCTDTHPEVEHK